MYLAPGVAVGVEHILTGDGKAMACGNVLEGHFCWSCDAPASSWSDQLSPLGTFPPGPRFGANLRAIPPSHRVGDYVHCVARILNILFKRLLAELTTISKAGPLKTFLTKLTMQAQGVPLPERLAPNVGKR